MTGAVLLALLAAEGFTILSLGQLLTPHFFIGMLLLGPVALKAGSTIYRFIRYYAGSAPYRRKGPPALLLRLLGPVVIASTAGVFGTGIALAVTGPAGRQPWLFLHKPRSLSGSARWPSTCWPTCPGCPGFLSAKPAAPRPGKPGARRPGRPAAMAAVPRPRSAAAACGSHCSSRLWPRAW
jgi:hypothetical protein